MGHPLCDRFRKLDRGVFCLIMVEDLVNNSKWMLSSLYGPNSNSRRDDFWRELNDIRSRWSGGWCVSGDWNVIRFPSKKLGGCRISSKMRSLSDWVSSHSLIDLHLGGAAFTSSNHQTLLSNVQARPIFGFFRLARLVP